MLQIYISRASIHKHFPLIISSLASAPDSALQRRLLCSEVEQNRFDHIDHILAKQELLLMLALPYTRM